MTTTTITVESSIADWAHTTGIGRDKLEDRLHAACAMLLGIARDRDAVAKERDVMFTNLGNTQTRCTALLDELRGWRSGPDVAPLFGEVAREMWRATAKHGSVDKQNLPLGIGSPDAVAYEALAKQRCDIARANGTLSWSDVLDEESAEVLGAKTPGDARKEALQTACVAIRMVQAIDAQETAK